MKTPITLLCYFLFLAHSFANYQIDGTATQLAIQTCGKIILVPGEVDNVSGYFILDTGAPELILNKHYFDGRRKGHKKLMEDIDNTMECHVMQVRHFTMGNVYRDDFPATITDLKATEEALGREILGLLGYDVLQHFEIRIDYYAGSITFCDLDRNGRPLSKWQSRVADHEFQFNMQGHLPVIRGHLPDREDLDFALDSGASVNIMDRNYKKYLRQNSLKVRTIDFQCVRSTVKDAPYYIMPEMQLENAYHIQFWRTSIGNFSGFRSNKMYFNAILGANFFQLGKITINYRLQKIEIWDNPGRLNRRYRCLGHG